MDRFFAYYTARVSRHATVAAVAAVAAFFGVVALGCIVASVWISAIPIVGQGRAPLIAAVPLAILCLAGCLIARHLAQGGVAPAAPDLSVTVVAAATRLTREQPATALAAALIAGVLAGITRPK